MATPRDANEHLPHPLLYRPVRDIASGRRGVLMAVVHEEVGYGRWQDIAYIRPPRGGRETTTAVANIEAWA
ncbi:hypothetical protein [Streptomyces sp. NPDC001502]|uniref:hypothetical protein n=1 Tax=Streptomyces sp. NPDC001502 TaxID=3364578 RepID=UPI0036B9F418